MGQFVVVKSRPASRQATITVSGITASAGRGPHHSSVTAKCIQAAGSLSLRTACPAATWRSGLLRRRPGRPVGEIID